MKKRKLLKNGNSQLQLYTAHQNAMKRRSKKKGRKENCLLKSF
jgi:hypothetical protein